MSTTNAERIGQAESTETAKPRASQTGEKTKVFLSVYRIAFKEPLVYNIYHSGVEAHGIEYYFGDGVFEIAPHTWVDRIPPFLLATTNVTVTFMESILIGETYLSQEEVRAKTVLLGQKGLGVNDYNVMLNNCNHFSEQLLKMITGNGIPDWVNAPATASAAVHQLHIDPHAAF